MTKLACIPGGEELWQSDQIKLLVTASIHIRAFLVFKPCRLSFPYQNPMVSPYKLLLPSPHLGTRFLHPTVVEAIPNSLQATIEPGMYLSLQQEQTSLGNQYQKFVYIPLQQVSLCSARLINQLYTSS